MNEKRLDLHFEMLRDQFSLRLDLTIDVTEPVALFGPSGSGKTSVLRAVSGLESADSGRIALGDDVWQDEKKVVPAWRRSVGYVFQDARLFSHMNVKGNLDVAARSSEPAKLRRDEIIEKLNIGHLLERDTDALSGGETQRVAIARTLLTRPRLLLMDEPVSSLDSESRQETIEYIASLTDSFDLPLLYVTHDAGEVARLASTTVLLDKGQVRAAGRTPEVFAKIGRGFSGLETVSILAAQVSGQFAGLADIRIGNQELHIPLSGRSAGEQVQLRIDATDVVLATRHISDTSIRNVLEGRIAELQALASGTAEVLIDIEGQLLKAHVTSRAIDALGLHPGGRVYAMIKSVALGNQTR